MAKKNKKTTAPEQAKYEAADNILKAALGKFPVVLVIGVNDKDVIDFATNVPQYQYLQWLVNKSSFELFIHERNNIDAKNAEEVAKLVENATSG